MFAPFLRSIGTLLALVALYQAYVLTVAPLVEPPAVKRTRNTITQKQRQGGYQAIGRYQKLLAAYFPANHWSLAEPPKIFRHGDLLFVGKDYRVHDDASIDIDSCVVLSLPKDWHFGVAPPRETIIVEVPGGGHFQFDEQFDLARGEIGELIRGELKGTIVIRSDMKEAGPQDDLLIETRDLIVNKTLIRTDARVDAQLGPNRAGGRKMDIRLLSDRHAKRRPSISGVQSLAIYENVALELDAGKADIFDEEKPADKVAERIHRQVSNQLPKRIRLAAHTQLTQQAPDEPDFNPPVQVTCQGRFHFDLLEYVASFERKVEVRRMRLDGPFDGLDCSELSVKFSVVDDQGIPIVDDNPNLTRKQRSAAKSVKPILVTAIGSPARAESAAEGGSLRARRMQIHLIDRRITLDGGHEVMLRHKRDEIHAPKIVYQMPDSKSPRALGELSIAGPGWLRLMPDDTRPDRVVDLGWKAVEGTAYPVQLTRRRGQPVLLLQGQPIIDAHRLGKIKAQRIELLLSEVPADGPDGPALEVSKSKTKLAVIPERLLAAGGVEFSSPELTGSTHQLEADFEPWVPKEQLDAEAAAVAASTRQPSGSGTNRRADREKPPKSQYDLKANQIHLDLALTGKTAEPTSATCDGSVLLRETRTAKAGEQPVIVSGDRLQVRGLDAKALITVTGRKKPTSANPGGATIDARGMTLVAERIDADQAAGKFWVNGPGLATMNINGEALGEPADTTIPVTLTWQTGLDAAGQRIIVQGRVLGESQHGWLQADRLTAKLTQPLAFERNQLTSNKRRKEKIEIAEVMLSGGVVVDHRGQDDQGQNAHDNLQIKSLAYNHLTGDIRGTGPGVLRSVRISDGNDDFAGLAGAASARQTRPAQPTNESTSKLRFFRADFAEGLTGNAERRVMRFHRRVRTVYGPVDDWQQELPLHNASQLPPDTVTLACELLEVSEDPVAKRQMLAIQPASTERKTGLGQLGPIEVRAVDNVEIEGRSEKEGLFQAQATTASYNQLKDLFVLRGDGQQDAVLRHHDAAKGRYVETPAGTILYWRAEPRVELRDVSRPMAFEQTTPQQASRPRPDLRDSPLGGKRPQPIR